MSRNDRMKASQLWAQSHHPFAVDVTFEEKYPMIADLQVEVHKTGTGTFAPPFDHVIMTKDTFRKFVDCENPICYNGGVDIEKILEGMVKSRQTHAQVTEFCQGYEGSPKGAKRYRSCINRFDVKISATYK